MTGIQLRNIFLTILLFYSYAVSAQLSRKDISADSLKKKTELLIDKNKKAVEKSFSKENLKARFDEKVGQTIVGKLFKKDTAQIQKPNVSLKDFSVENSTQYIKTDEPGTGRNFINRIGFSGQLELFKFPVDLELVNNFNPLNNFNIQEGNLFKFDFVKPGFEQLYQSKVGAFKNLKERRFNGLNPEILLKQQLNKQLQLLLKGKLADYPRLQAYINNPQALKELLAMDEQQIKLKLKNLLDDTQEQLKKTVTSANNTVSGMVQSERDGAVSEITNYVMRIKSEINAAGLDTETITLLQNFAENKIDRQMLQSFFISQLSKQSKLQGANHFYSKIKEFQAGNFGHKLPGSFMNRDLLLNGVNVSLKTARGPVTLGVASNQDIGAPKDFDFTNSTYSFPKLYSFVSVPTTNFSFGMGKISWTGVFDKEFSKSSGAFSSAVPKNNMVFTLSQNLNIQHLGKLTVDISKSATQLKNLSLVSPDRLIIDRNTMGNYFRDDFLETMSVGLNHQIDAVKTGLSSNVYFNYSGIGFQNPGQQGLANMNMRFGGTIKQNLFKNKFTIYLKSDIKNTPISAETNAHWRNFNVQVDSRIRFSKSYTLNFKYIENGVNKVAETSSAMYSSQKIQADFNGNYKIGGHYSFSHLTLGKQKMNNLGSLQSPDFLMLNYSQSLLFKDFSLNGNAFYNRELGGTALLGNMLNADVALQYSLFRNISLSSGLTYLNNEQVAKQVGLKQSIQLMVKKHFDVNAYVDLRKNLINPLYPDLFSTGRAEFSIRYYLDKQ
ncbi:hypothetical protein [Pedobacter rhodius]|uniref:Uncharacterized protein n=1 Tax=Pedobacter rhodius TaxID=3004098 RepID=A0ABT4KU78_9SPHI|nr:hypothetical protein [Pedobacter sp. SJ11]MCZ4222503.1 hypothetical protein [Pedobacter sp. SJ11]